MCSEASNSTCWHGENHGTEHGCQSSGSRISTTPPKCIPAKNHCRAISGNSHESRMGHAVLQLGLGDAGQVGEIGAPAREVFLIQPLHETIRQYPVDSIRKDRFRFSMQEWIALVVPVYPVPFFGRRVGVGIEFRGQGYPCPDWRIRKGCSSNVSQRFEFLPYWIPIVDYLPTSQCV